MAFDSTVHEIGQVYCHKPLPIFPLFSSSVFQTLVSQAFSGSHGAFSHRRDQLDEQIHTNGSENGNPKKLISNGKLQFLQDLGERDFEREGPHSDESSGLLAWKQSHSPHNSSSASIVLSLNSACLSCMCHRLSFPGSLTCLDIYTHTHIYILSINSKLLKM